MPVHIQYPSFSCCVGLPDENGRRLRHGRDDCLRVRTGREHFPFAFRPVKQDDIKGTSGNPEGL
ncbi:MAG: hypothetical protein OSJ72_20010 [Lachnospiraceae bacterium]|nr:hypothetical protein [Lachnospiraceae bacterium]